MRKRIPRKDSREKTNGTAKFTSDIQVPGMLTAVVAHSALFGAKLKSFDASKAKAVRGVVDVVQIPSGLAVLATNFWSAKQGRDALTVQWDETGAQKLGSAELIAQYKALAAKPGLRAHKAGDVEKAFAGAKKTLEVSFEFPYLAHSAMEPMNCVIQLKVTLLGNGGFRVDRVVCAVDCGVAVNPDAIRAQMEGGIGFGLSAALHGAITLTNGRVEQSNFHDYKPLRINEMPKVEVHIVPSNEKPTGVGEPGVPPIALAVANALAAATGKRLRNLPLKLA